MINKNILLKNLLKRTPILEYSANDLVNMSDEKRRVRSKYSKGVYYKGITQSTDGIARILFDSKSHSHTGKMYKQIIEIHTPSSNLISIIKEKWDMKRFSKTLKESDVKVWCNCPDFYYGGQKYNLGAHGKYKGGLASKVNAGYADETDVTNIAPNVRDPDREHVLCKHLISVMEVLPFNSSKIMADARKVDTVIKPNKTLTSTLDSGEVSVKEDINMVSVGKSVNDEVINEIINSNNEMDHTNNAEEIIDEMNEEIIDDNIDSTDTKTNNVIDISDNANDLIDDINEEVIDDDVNDVNDAIGVINEMNKLPKLFKDTNQLNIDEIL